MNLIERALCEKYGEDHIVHNWTKGKYTVENLTTHETVCTLLTGEYEIKKKKHKLKKLTQEETNLHYQRMSL